MYGRIGREGREADIPPSMFYLQSLRGRKDHSALQHREIKACVSGPCLREELMFPLSKPHSQSKEDS